MALTIESLFAQPDNAPVLEFLEVDRPEDVGYFEVGDAAGSLFDEGGQVFFHQYGRRLPAETRCTLSIHNLLVHDQTARIFALHHGRFTFALRAIVPGVPELSQCVGGLRGETMDGTVDLRSLGPYWGLYFASNDEAEPDVTFRRVYELAGQ